MVSGKYYNTMLYFKIQALIILMVIINKLNWDFKVIFCGNKSSAEYKFCRTKSINNNLQYLCNLFHTSSLISRKPTNYPA